MLPGSLGWWSLLSFCSAGWDWRRNPKASASCDKLTVSRSVHYKSPGPGVSSNRLSLLPPRELRLVGTGGAVEAWCLFPTPHVAKLSPFKSAAMVHVFFPEAVAC